MTNNQKTFLKALKTSFILAVTALAAAPAFAQNSANLSALQIAQANEIYDSRYVTMLSTTPGNGAEQTSIRLYYVGTATEAVVTVGSTGITFYAPNAVLDTAFPAGLVSATTYPTVGAMCDAINLSPKYQCRMEDARRSDLPATLLGTTAASGVNNLKSVGGFAVAFTNASNSTSSAPYWLSLGINPPSDRRVILKKCVVTAASTANTAAQFSISGVKRSLEGAPDGVVRNDSTIVWYSSTTAGTATTYSFDSSGVGGISFAAANQGISGPSTGLPSSPSQQQPTPPNTLGRVVIRVQSDVNTLVQNSGDSLSCEWTDR